MICSCMQPYKINQYLETAYWDSIDGTHSYASGAQIADVVLLRMRHGYEIISIISYGASI